MKKTKTYSTNRVILPLLFILFSILFEIINFLWLGFKNSSDRLIVVPEYFIFDLAVIIMIAAVIFFMQNTKAVAVFFYLFLSFHFLLNIANSTMYKIFGDILTLDLIKVGGEGLAAAEAGFIDWIGSVINVVVFAVFVTVSALLLRYNKKTFSIKSFSYFIFAIAICILGQSIGASLFAIGQSTLKEGTNDAYAVIESDRYLWDNLQFKIDSYMAFGHFGFYSKYFTKLILGDNVSEDEIKEIQDYMAAGRVAENKNAPLYDQNLIFILCESMDSFAADPINTPLLWSLSTGQSPDSVALTNFHARNRTNNSEGITLIGNMPRNITLPESLTNGFKLNYSLPALFKATSSTKDTITTYIHGLDTFYSRDTTHGEGGGLGFDKKYSVNDYTGDQSMKQFKYWMSDAEFVENMIDKFIPSNERFLTYFASLSTHGPYTGTNENFAEFYETFDNNWEEYKAWVEENTDIILPEKGTTVYNQFRHYKASFIDFEKAVSILISTLEERGLKDSTSIVFYGDHNAYYHNLCNNIKGVKNDDFSNLYINHIPAFMYSPALTQGNPIVIDTFCNTYDLLPTVCDLYGLGGNTSWFQGYSVFSEDIEKSFFSSNLSGMFDENFFCTSVKNIITNNTDSTMEDLSSFKEKVVTFYKRQALLEKIYKNRIVV